MIYSRIQKRDKYKKIFTNLIYIINLLQCFIPSRRAGSSVWYERSVRNRKVAGSNPAQSIQPSVRKTNLKNEIAISSVLSIQIRKQEPEMRDLYNRKEKLTHWIQKAKTDK